MRHTRMTMLKAALCLGVLAAGVLCIEVFILIPRQIDDAYIPIWKRVVAYTPFVLASVGLSFSILGRRSAAKKMDFVIPAVLNGICWIPYPALLLFAQMYAA